MNVFKKLFDLFKRTPNKSSKNSVPLLIIKEQVVDANVKEYNSIQDAIAELENDPNVSIEKIDKLKSSIKILKDKTSIKIKNGEIIK